MFYVVYADSNPGTIDTYAGETLDSAFEQFVASRDPANAAVKRGAVMTDIGIRRGDVTRSDDPVAFWISVAETAIGDNEDFFWGTDLATVQAAAEDFLKGPSDDEN